MRASIGEGARTLLVEGRTRALAASPLHYADGDMRRNYDWRRALLAAGLATGLLVVLSRAVLTGLFVAFVSADPSLVAAFNLGLTVLASGAFALPALLRLWGRLRWRRYVPRSLRRWGAQRIGKQPRATRL